MGNVTYLHQHPRFHGENLTEAMRDAARCLSAKNHPLPPLSEMMDDIKKQYTPWRCKDCNGEGYVFMRMRGRDVEKVGVAPERKRHYDPECERCKGTGFEPVSGGPDNAA